MGVRIYSLAKELNVDSKELVEICTRAGITGKGSALASLTDEEVAKIKAFLSAGSRPAAPAPTPAPAAPAAPPPLTRPSGPLSRPASGGSPPPLVRPGAPGTLPPAGTGRVPQVKPPAIPVRAAAPAVAAPPTPAATPASPPAAAAPVAPEVPPAPPAPVVAPAASAPAESAPPAMQRPSTLPTQSGPVRSLGARPSPAAPERPAPAAANRPAPSPAGGGPLSAHRAGPAPTTPAAPAPEVETPAAPPTPAASVPPTPAAPPVAPAAAETPASPAASGAPVRPAASGPLRTFASPLQGRQTGGVRALSPSGPRPADGGAPGEARKPRTGDGPKTNIRMPVRMAPLPPTKPQAPTKSNEPPAQQPVIRLPADLLKQRQGNPGGSNPLKDFVKKAEADRAAGGDRKPGGPPGTGGRPRPGAAPPPAAAPAAGGVAGRAKKGKGRPGEEDEEAAEAARRKAKPSRHRKSRRDEEGGGPSPTKRLIRQRGSRAVSTAAPRKSGVVIELPTTVRGFCEAAGIPAAKLLKKLMDLKVAANINAWLDDDSAEFLAAEFGIEAEFKRPVDLEDELIGGFDESEDAAEDLQPRAPIITFLGHVDHGKTSLLDKIIGINVVAGESGGITQHIRAYKIEHNGHPIAFVDTPGHEAFTEMRARGANVTDIAVLVVAADDGVMPQTEEALNHARAADVPIIVALNKTDLPYNKDKIYQQLAAVNLLPAEWGGDVEVVPTSALTGAGIPELLETILTLADLHELRANPDRAATGTCLESRQEGDRGVVAKIIVQNGTLRTGDVVVCGSSFGRVRAMFNPLRPRETVEEAGPSTPVDLIGFDEAPLGGDPFHVLDDITQAREIADIREELRRNNELGPAKRGLTLEAFQAQLGQKEKTKLNLIIRADTRGSIEAIKKELTKLENPEVEVRVLQAMVGTVTEADVHLADASQAIVIAFNVVPDEKAASLAKDRQIEIRRFQIIYEITDQVRKAIEGKLAPEERTVELGVALVLRTFSISRLGTIAGCRVHRGTIERNTRLRIIRDGRIIGDYGIESLRREKDDVKEVREGYECGIRLSGFNDLKEGDVFECYRTEKVARTL